MSLVQSIITENFVLVAADKRAICPNGDIVENQNKLIKLNKEIIFGCTGGTLDNFKLFDGYCNYSIDEGFSRLDTEPNICYNEFIEIISNRFQTLYNEHVNKKIKRQYDIGSVVCGYGKEFESTVFSIGSPYGIPDGISKATKSINFPYKGVTAGMKIHNDKLEELYQQLYFKYGKLTLRQCKNIMLDVFENGLKEDETINNIVRFENIKKKDVI